MTVAVVLFGSVAARAIAYLEPLIGVPCRGEVANPRDDEWVRIVRTGGGRVDEITEAAQITVEAWALTHERAEDLAQLARAYLTAMRGQVAGVYRIDEFGGPVDLPDPDSYQFRWTFTLSVRVRGAQFP